ncbi:hypothetical protein KAU51_04220 [Candidatus Parcubacteria bacterium]|nr:hypothetical protein [Candidatus Parcubacteria bacterium]
MKEKTLINTMEWIIGIVMFTAMIVIVNTGIKKSEMRECQKWQNWEERYPHFTASKSMREQCEKYNIKLERRWEK